MPSLVTSKVRTHVLYAYMLKLVWRRICTVECHVCFDLLIALLNLHWFRKFLTEIYNHVIVSNIYVIGFLLNKLSDCSWLVSLAQNITSPFWYPFSSVCVSLENLHCNFERRDQTSVTFWKKLLIYSWSVFLYSSFEKWYTIILFILTCKTPYRVPFDNNHSK